MAAAPGDVRGDETRLTAMGDKAHVGESPGQGAMVKTATALRGVHIAVAAEASLAAKVGVDMRIPLETCPARGVELMLKDRGPRMLQEEPEVTSAVDIFVKDLASCCKPGATARLPCLWLRSPIDVPGHLWERGWNADDSQVIRACTERDEVSYKRIALLAFRCQPRRKQGVKR